MLPVIKDRKIKIAIIGCGRIAQNHFTAIEDHSDEFEIVAVCDANEKTLAKYTSKYNVQGYDNYLTLMRESDCDIVSLCTPSGQHAEQTICAAKYGKNVITEKPMATNWEDGLAMVKACDEANVHLFVIKQNRNNATMQLLKRAMDDERFGKIYMAHVNLFWTRAQDYYDSASWRGTWEMDGGAFMNQASHYVDLLEWLIGPISDVHAMTATLARDIQVEDTGVLNLRWRSGALGSMAVTMLTYPQNLEGSITILGEKGTVRVGGVAINDIQLWQFADQKDYDAEVKNISYQTDSVYGFGHSLYFKNVADVFRGKTLPKTDGHEGLSSLEVLAAAYLSACNNKTISLPLKQ